MKSPDIAERFAHGLDAHLAADGYALVVLSSAGEETTFLEALKAEGFDRKVLSQRDLFCEVLRLYQVCRSSDPVQLEGQG